MTFFSKQAKNITKQKNMRAQADRQNPFRARAYSDEKNVES